MKVPYCASGPRIGYYHEKYGDAPQETLVGMVRAETLDEDAKRLLLHGDAKFGGGSW